MKNIDRTAKSVFFFLISHSIYLSVDSVDFSALFSKPICHAVRENDDQRRVVSIPYGWENLYWFFKTRPHNRLGTVYFLPVRINIRNNVYVILIIILYRFSAHVHITFLLLFFFFSLNTHEFTGREISGQRVQRKTSFSRGCNLWVITCKRRNAINKDPKY